MPESSLHVEMTGNEARFQAALNRANAEVQKLKDKLRDMGSAGDKARQQLEGMGKAGVAAAGPAMQNMVAGLATKWIGVGTAIMAVKAYLADFDKQMQESAKLIRGLEEPHAQMVAEAGGDPAKLTLMKNIARDLYRKGGAKDLPHAYQIVTALANEDMMQMYQKMATMYPILSQPEMTIPKIAAFQKAFGTAEAGDERAVLDKLLKAGAIAPGTESLESIAEAGAKMAGAAKVHGWTDEQVLAMVTLGSKTLGGATAAGAAFGALGKGAMQVPELVGLPVEQMVDQIMAMKLGEAGVLSKEEMNIPGLAEATMAEHPEYISQLVGAKALSAVMMVRDQRKALAEYTSEIEKGEREKYSEQLAAQQLNDPAMRAVRDARMKKAELELLREEHGIARERLQAREDEMTYQQERAGVPYAVQWAGKETRDLTHSVIGQAGYEGTLNAFQAVISTIKTDILDVTGSLKSAAKSFANQVKDPRQGGCHEVNK
jgi:hypothetical protein